MTITNYISLAFGISLVILGLMIRKILKGFKGKEMNKNVA